RKASPDQLAGLDLSRWSVAFNGAEPIRPETLDRFAEAFEPYGFRRDAFLPCYGLAEATLMVSGTPWSSPPVVVAVGVEALKAHRVAEPDDHADARALVGSGNIGEDLEVLIVDPESARPVATGRVGEVWVAGPSVARGYWERPDATLATFGARLDDGRGPFLRTGDLGFLRDGELFVTGRLTDLIIIRGQNVYPHDVEQAAESCHPALRAWGVAAFAVEIDGEERLALVLEVERPRGGAPTGEIVAAVRRAVAEGHDLEVHAVALIRPMSLPRTSSGKVRRRACRDAFLAGTLDLVALDEARAAPALARPTPSDAPSLDLDAIRAGLIDRLARRLGVDRDAIDPRRPLASFGLGSLQAVALAGELEDWLGRPLPPTLAYEYPTIDALARHLAGIPDPAPASEAIGRGADDEPIAIIGIGCRFPGADGPGAFWRLLHDGVDAVGDVPPDRWAACETDPPNIHRGGFLDRVDLFDADFFGVAPREAAGVDPQQRLLLEVAWEALEDAGQAPSRLAGTGVGVFIGISTHDYLRLRWGLGPGDAYALAGNAASIAANRLSYALDLRGPSLAVDTACSSSLVAIELACRSLRSGEATLALAGGVNVILAPEVAASFAAAGFLAADGRCKAFDSRADGYGRGEGAGVVVLKPLSRAIADGDPIRAVIRGGAINQDGRTNGLNAPSRAAQEDVLRAAYRRAGVDPGRVDYVEAHGTGTALGDPIEARALGAVLGVDRPADRPCRVGSVKTNIGHLEAAAGVAGVIKVALALEHGAIPPSLHFENPNPNIPFADLGLRVQDAPESWPEADTPAVAGVSSFGFGGTNAHLVLEAAPAAIARPAAPGAGPLVLPISARHPESLRDLAQSYRNLPESGDDSPSLGDLAFTAATRREHHDHRLAVVAEDRAGLIAGLDAFLRGERHPGFATGRVAPTRTPDVVFVFSGQGAQWPGMGRALLDEPAARAMLERCDEALRTRSGWSLLEAIAAGALGGTDVSQPVFCAVQIALAALWRSWGIEPAAVVGHSLGELAAAHVAGALGLEEALRIALERGRLMARVAGLGKTLATGLAPDEAARVVAGSAGRLALAAVNGPRSTTISGDPEAIDALLRDLDRDGVFARELPVPCAFHGPQMDPLRPELAASLADLRPRAEDVPIVSAVTGRPIAGMALDASYWGRNLREPVRFADAISALADAGREVFLEVGPHPGLSSSIADVARARGRTATVLGSLRRDDGGRAPLLRSLATLWALGRPVAWPAVVAPGRCVPLPRYPWRRERHWLEPAPASPPLNSHHAANGHTGANGKALTSHITPQINNDLYEVRWERRDAAVVAEAAAGDWLIVADRGGVGGALRALLEARGAARVVVAGSDIGPSLDRGGPFRGVVDLRALDLDGDPAPLLGETIGLARALPSTTRLVLATRGAQAVADATVGERGVAQAALWGLGRSLALGRVEGAIAMIDLDPGTDGDDAAVALCDELLGPGVEDQVAVRDGRRHVARLARRAIDGEAPPIRPEGTYLITGGLGALGLRAARWLVDRGARRLVLLGRRGLPARRAWASLPADDPARKAIEVVEDLERDGATILTAAVDVADVEGLSAAVNRLLELLPTVRGVIHAAGIVAPEGLDPTSPEGIRAVLRPKVAGAWALHEVSRSWPLDFFVNISSAAGVFGAKDLAYAAANAALDAFASQRRGLALPATSVALGPIVGDGMASTPDRARSFRALGMNPIDPGRALDAIGLLAGPGPANAVVAAIDWPTFRSLAGRRPFLERIDDHEAATNGHANGWHDGPIEDRRERLARYFRDRVARVLGVAADRLDVDRPISTLGLDSLMAIELKAGAEADLGVTVPLASLFEGPTVAQLADAALVRLDADNRRERPPVPRADAASGLPISPGQRSLWSLHRLDPDSAAYHVAGAARIRAALDVEALRRSFQALVDRHPALRATFPTDPDGRPSRRTADAAAVDFRAVDVGFLDDSTIHKCLVEEACRPFDLEAGPVFRARLFTRSDDDHDLLISAHHILCDFWSVAILLDELGQLYTAEVSGRPAGLPPVEAADTDAIRQQVETLDGPDGERLAAYWDRRLAAPLPALDLPADRPRPARPTGRGAKATATIDAALAGRLVNLGAEHGASLFVTLLAAFQALLARESGQDDVLVGTPVAGRDRPGLADVVGYFVNPLPIRVDVSDDPDFLALLGRVRRLVLDAIDHKDYPFPLMVDRLDAPRDPSRSPVFQVMFAFQQAQRLGDRGLSPFVLRGDGPTMELAGVPVESVALDLGAAQFDLTLNAAEAHGRIELAAEYSTDLFDAATIDRLLHHFMTLLASIVADPDRPISALPLITADERDDLIRWARGPQGDLCENVCIHQWISEQAARTPDATAVACDDAAIAYRDLESRSNRLARRLRALGVGPEVPVALCAARSVELIVGVLAILKAGGAYVPLDPDYPADRLALMLDDAKAPVLLSDRRTIGTIPTGGASVVLLDDVEAVAGFADGPIDDVARPENLAYIIFTSGSTGRPKGVMVSHRNLVHSTRARFASYPERVEAFLLLSSIAFDSSVAGLFWTLCDGGTLVLPPPGAKHDPVELADLLARHRISHVLGVPTLWSLILAEAPADRLATLRRAIVAGEACPRSLVDRHRATVPGVLLSNEYGPTEATVWATVHHCDGPPHSPRVPIGRPIDNTNVPILDRWLEPVPVGVAGMVYIGGAGVARGYRAQPGATAEAFVPDPFATTPGARLYRTGDRARWNPDGTIEFLGRADDQVKVRGFRIEPAEVEAVLRGLDGVRDAAVIARNDPDGQARLVAYVVPTDPAAPPFPAELRRGLRGLLPEAMVPTAFVILDGLPTTPNGKVDRRALPEAESADAGGPYVAPRDDAEEALARLAAGVLGVPVVGIFDDLFALGIDSIRGIQLAARARREGLRLKPAHVFEHPTIAALAAVADREEFGEATAVDPDLNSAAFPLSPAQEGMLFHTLAEPDRGAYIQQTLATLRGPLDPSAFEAAWHRLVARHEALRTAFVRDGGRPLQVVHPEVTLPIAALDWRGLDAEERGRRLDQFLRADRALGFDPARPPLSRWTTIRLDDASHMLIWTCHHILMDGWCLPVLLGEVLELYEGALHGREPGLPARRPYRDFIAWLGRRDLAAADSFWRAELAGFDAPTPLEIDRPDDTPGMDVEDSGERVVRLSAAESDALRVLAASRRLTLNTLFQGAWALLLGRYAGREDVVFGATTSGRPAELDGVESMIGLFLNTIPVRVAIDEAARLTPWLRGLQSRQAEARNHEHTPLVRIRAASELPPGRALFESLLVVENVPVDPALLGHAGGLGVDAEGVRVVQRTNYPLAMIVEPAREVVVRAIFDANRFSGAAIDRLLGHLRTILAGMAADPDARLADLPMLTPAERRQLERWSDQGPRRPRSAAAEIPGAADVDRLSDSEVDALLARLSCAGEALDG
ncbi:MAG TPA: amino acid adenylation domain-containing protein, partial [Isosphaeraceae bacterium]|nr:amino acid adenylation domain-containing protein [Isosphaeraceae bacterium]